MLSFDAGTDHENDGSQGGGPVAESVVIPLRWTQVTWDRCGIQKFPQTFYRHSHGPNRTNALVP